jgi:cytochrome P450
VAQAFEIVLIVVVGIGVIGAVISLRGTGALYDKIGKGAFSLDEPDKPKGPAPGSAAAVAEAQAEIRQMVEAKSHRREARGEGALDVEAEIAALTRPAGGADDELRDEVRQLVIAGNERRARRGQEPLDVDAEVERQLRDLGA